MSKEHADSYDIIRSHTLNFEKYYKIVTDFGYMFSTITNSARRYLYFMNSIYQVDATGDGYKLGMAMLEQDMMHTRSQ